MVLDLKLTIQEDDVAQSSASLLKHVRPCWRHTDVKFKIFTEGITNKLVGCYVDTDVKDIVLIRIFGKNTELLIDRKAEVASMKKLVAVGGAAPLYATFTNGICYGFIPGETLDEKTVRDKTVARLVAETFVKYHRMQHSNGETPQPILFPVLKRYFKYIPTSFDDPDKNARLRKCIPTKEELKNELAILETHLTSLGSPVVFCHNDALLKNIVYDREKERVVFIDYEYAGYNYQAFDIGNHFCEFAGVTDMDFSCYPDHEFQLSWLRTYLEYYHGNDGLAKVTSDEVEKLYVQVNKFALVGYISKIKENAGGRNSTREKKRFPRKVSLFRFLTFSLAGWLVSYLLTGSIQMVAAASHFLWGLWGLVQASCSTIDFDYLGFSIARFNEYFARRDEFLSLPISA